MESMNGRERILRTIDGGEADRLPLMPITMTLAADLAGERYRDYATDWRALVRGQMAVAETFGFDHVSAISDPAVESSDLGGKVIFYDDEPPANDESGSLFADKYRLRGIAAPRPEDGRRMSNRLAAVSGLASRAAGALVVEGWVEGPCAEAADLRGLSRIMTDFFDDPDFVSELLDFVTELEIAFALAQIRAGAGLIGVGDAASSLIGPELFGEYALERHRRYVAAIHGAGALARLHICGNSGPLLPVTRELGYDIIDLDSMVDMAEARAVSGPGQVFNGNLDPVRLVRNGSPESIVEALDALAAVAGRAWIVGAGCEMPRGTPRANILAMRDFARGRRPG